MRAYGIALFVLSLLATPVAPCIAEPAPPRVIEQLQQFPFLEGRFVQSRQLQGLARPLSSDGNFIFWRDHGLYLETLSPFYQALTFTEGDVISWLSPTGEPEPATENDPVQQYVSRILLAVFSADLSLLQRLFQIDWQDDGAQWSVELVPDSAAVARVILLVQLEGDRHLRSLRVTAQNGDVSRMEFTDISDTAPAPGRCARFDRHGQLRCPGPANALR